MRKEMELDIEARILVDLAIGDQRVDELVREHEALIKEEVRADDLAAVDDGHRKTWDVEGVEMEIAIAPVAAAEASD
jgi:isoleucyl-tRNA synthetase